MLKNQWGRYMQSHELLPVLGFKPGGHLPKEGFKPVEVEGVLFYCEPAGEPRVNSWGRKIGASKHRIHYFCKACRKWVPFGRAYQHNKGRQHKLNNEAMVGRP